MVFQTKLGACCVSHTITAEGTLRAIMRTHDCLDDVCEIIAGGYKERTFLRITGANLVDPRKDKWACPIEGHADIVQCESASHAFVQVPVTDDSSEDDLKSDFDRGACSLVRRPPGR